MTCLAVAVSEDTVGKHDPPIAKPTTTTTKAPTPEPKSSTTAPVTTKPKPAVEPAAAKPAEKLPPKAPKEIPLPTCSFIDTLFFHSGNVCFDTFSPAPVDVPRVDFRAYPESCHFLENFYFTKPHTPPHRPMPQAIPSPPAPPVPHTSVDGVPELVPVPCKPCDQDRKDPLFIRGSPYSNSLTKLLVDHASAQSGGKILAHSDNLRGVSDILAADGNRYLLTVCSSKAWFTIRLADEVFIEKIGVIANELFASTFRHIQILGSRQFPTNEWRVLGDIETNPMETQEWFDLSAASQCSKCYVKYLKIRVLTHHALEGYTNCALTRIQVFGSTVLQSLDRIQGMNSSVAAENGVSNTGQIPAFVKMGARAAEIVEARVRYLNGGVPSDGGSPPIDPSSGDHRNPPMTESPEPPPSPGHDDENNPLLKFIEEMTVLKKQYQSVANSVFAMNELMKTHSEMITSSHGESAGGKNETLVPKEETTIFPGVVISILGVPLTFPKLKIDVLWAVIACLAIVQAATLVAVMKRTATPTPPPPPVRSIMVSLNQQEETGTSGRRFSVRPQAVQFKKRHHGLWRPKLRRALFHQADADDDLPRVMTEPDIEGSPVVSDERVKEETGGESGLRVVSQDSVKLEAENAVSAQLSGAKIEPT